MIPQTIHTDNAAASRERHGWWRNARLGVALVLSLSALAQAEASVSCPLDGYYRVGQFMPIRVSGANASPITITADGAMPIEVASGQSEMTLPLLVVSRLSNLRCNGNAVDVPLKMLGENDRLVACSPSGLQFAKQLFPGQNLIAVDVDARRSIPSADTLDAIVIDDNSIALSQEQFAAWLAAGTVIGIRSPTAPDGTWPWRRIGDYQVLRFDLAGPRGAIGGEAAYSPTFGWRPGQPANFRRELVIVAIVFAILLVAASLVRQRWTIVLVMLIALIMIGAAEVWRRRGGFALRSVDGAVACVDPAAAMTQADSWVYQTAPIAADATFPCLNETRPVFTDLRQFEETGMVLRIGFGKWPQFSYRIPAGARIAFLTRGIKSQTNLVIASRTVTSPMEVLAKQRYVEPGDSIVGQVDSYDMWPMVVIERGAPK